MPEARLEFNDAQGRRVVRVDKERFTIGRRSDNDLPLNGTEVSRVHAEIVRRGSRYVLADRKSRFGLFVNGEAVTERELTHLDRIRLGRADEVELTFLLSPGRAVERVTHVAIGDLRQMATLLEGLRALGSGRVLEDVLALVLDSTIDVAGAERGFIMLANAEGKLEFKVARARDRVTLPSTAIRGRKIPEHVFATGEPQQVYDMLEADLANTHSETIAMGIRNVLCVPLRLVRLAERGQSVEEGARSIIGVLYLDSREKGSLVSPAILSALETLATEAAVAIENARLYREALEKSRMDEELRIAAEMQQALLPPRRCTGSGFEADGAMIPCRAVGGDFFDYIDLPGGRIAFLLGDVAGKGPPAALLAAMVQGCFSAHAEADENPALTVSRVNRALTRRPVESRFATAVYAVLSPGGRLVSCNAGHNPLVLIRPDGSVRRLTKGGLILGLFDYATFEDEEVTLKPGDMLMLFSDGLNEARNAEDEEFGEDRLLACLHASRELEPSAILDRILQEVRAFSAGRPQADDVTALIMRYLGD